MPGFDVNSAKRIAKATRWVEDRYRNGVGRPASPTPNVYNKIGLTTSPITARAALTPGSGTVQPYLFDGTVLAAVADVPETVFNWTGSAVASGVLVQYMVIDGWLLLVGQDCSGVAV